MYGSTTKGGVVKRSDCIPVYGTTTKGDIVKRSDCILVYGRTTKGDVVKRSDCIHKHTARTLGSECPSCVHFGAVYSPCCKWEIGHTYVHTLISNLTKKITQCVLCTVCMYCRHLRFTYMYICMV